MKRTNLILDESLLKEAKQLLKADSFSAAVNEALAQAVKLVKARGLVDMFGTDIWHGDLGEMREDVRKTKKPRRRQK